MTKRKDAPLDDKKRGITQWNSVLLCGEKKTSTKTINKKTKRETMETKNIWQKILHIAITILTAIATTLGTTSCMGY